MFVVWWYRTSAKRDCPGGCPFTILRIKMELKIILHGIGEFDSLSNFLNILLILLAITMLLFDKH